MRGCKACDGAKTAVYPAYMRILAASVTQQMRAYHENLNVIR
jgi:hypothetical protein